MQSSIIGESEVQKSLNKMKSGTFNHIKPMDNLHRGLAKREVSVKSKKDAFSSIGVMALRVFAFATEQYVGNLSHMEKKNTKATIDHINKVVANERIGRGFSENYHEEIHKISQIKDEAEREKALADYKEAAVDVDLWFEFEDAMTEVCSRMAGAMVNGTFDKFRDDIKKYPRVEKHTF